MEYQFIIGFVGYLGLLAGLGAWFYKKSESSHDYTLGGRSLGYWTTAIAAHASDMSIWMFMGLPAAAYCTGMQSLWIPLGLIIGMFITWKKIAQPLRIATEKYNSETLSTFFEKRFSDTTGSLRLLSALFSLWFFTFYIASGLVGMGRLFESALHIDYHYGIALGLVIAIGYTLLGGFTGIAQTHFFQGIFLVALLIIIPVIVFLSLPAGFLWSQAAPVYIFSFFPHHAKELFYSLIIAVSWSIGYLGQPHILINFMGIKDPKSMPKAMMVGMIWQIITQGAAVIIGLLGIFYFTTLLADPQLVLISMVQTIFSEYTTGIILSAIVAAGLTTIATQILVTTATITHDIYKTYLNKHATPLQLASIARFTLIMVACMSFCIAFTNSSTVFGIVEYAWNGLGATFGPAVIAALYMPKATKQGVFLSMLCSGSIALFWPLCITHFPAIIPAFIIGISIIFLKKQ